MVVRLLDVNVLLALAWENHSHNPLARRWFSANVSDGWATCSLTQTGLVRLLSNPVFKPSALKPARAIEVLRTITSHPLHVFWNDDVPMIDNRFTSRIRGYRQIADAHLLGLCLRHGGRLVTFDRGIVDLCSTVQQRQMIEMVEPGQS